LRVGVVAVDSWDKVKKEKKKKKTTV